MNETPLIFDGALVRQHIARAKKNFAQHSALFDDCAEQIKERLSEVKREFPQTLDLSPFPFLGKPAAPSEPSDSLPLEGRVREGGAQHETPSGTSPPHPPPKPQPHRQQPRPTLGQRCSRSLNSNPHRLKTRRPLHRQPDRWPELTRTTRLSAGSRTRHNRRRQQGSNCPWRTKKP